jgi:translation elongation factor EF-G
MFVPDPVISLSIKPVDTVANDNFSKGVARFMKEDPTFRIVYDGDSKELIAYGMGELQLDIYATVTRLINLEIILSPNNIGFCFRDWNANTIVSAC